MRARAHDNLPMSRQFTNSLAVSTRYRVRFKLDGQRVPREFVGMYLGYRLDGGGVRVTEWSLRPAAGTSSIDEADLTNCWPTDEDVKLPATVRDGA